MNSLHANQKAGAWHKLSLYEQMGNIGTEVGRVLRAKKRNEDNTLRMATDRALELFDLTISDERRKKQLKEITRAREVFLDALSNEPIYNSNLTEIDDYFMKFAIAARLNK
ncbi:MAG: hypothetical protein PHW75_01320 [Patescibacteria group bacterium]|nr:hypothetical protein [Patescibacteria group bacterium]